MLKSSLLFALLLLTTSISFAEPKLPAKAFGSLPDVSSIQISPNGEYIAAVVRYTSGDTKGLLLQLIELKTLKKEILLTTDNSKYLIRSVRWASNTDILLSTWFPARHYNTPITATRLLHLDTVTKEIDTALPRNFIKRLDYIPVIQDSIVDDLPNSPDEIMISVRATDKVGSSVYRLNYKSGKSKRVHRFRDNTMWWMSDRQHQLRIANYFRDTTHKVDVRQTDDKAWNTIFEYQSFEDTEISPLGFDHNPNVLYYIALHDGRDAVFRADISKTPLSPELLYSHPTRDVWGRLIYSEKNRKVVGIKSNMSSGQHFWDEDYINLQKSIDKALPKTNNVIIDFSADERKIVILASSDVDSGSYILWNRDNKSMSTLAFKYGALNPELMAEKKSINYQARDGLDIHGYLTVPNESNSTPLPTIIFPHGGPISSDGKGFDYWTQFFANQGYAVLQMNFRGSYGYGFDFMTSGLKEWGGKMQTDVEDGTRWLIEQNIADPDRICVVGASYGGYAALMGAANNSDLYSCAISFAGVTDLPLLLTHARKYINHKVVKEMVGSNSKKLKAHSPVNRAGEIDIPVLLVQGTKDLRVNVKHGRKMHKKLKAANKNVEYIEFEDGNHYLSNEVHRIAFFEAMEAFLNQHLGQ